MKNDLTCEVVQDLLPSYVDHLTSDVTNTAIETHIRECADCRRILSDMQTPEPVPAETATDASTIDFLKKSNKRNKRRPPMQSDRSHILFLRHGFLSFYRKMYCARLPICGWF